MAGEEGYIVAIRKIGGRGQDGTFNEPEMPVMIAGIKVVEAPSENIARFFAPHTADDPL